MIYLDYSANTPVDTKVLETFCRTEQAYIGNPNSAHCAGQAAKREMARVTDAIAQQLGVHATEIIYTSGASESNNLAIKGIVQAAQSVGKHIISTPLEHSSQKGALQALEKQGYTVDMVRIGQDGKIDLSDLRALLREDTVLLAMSAVDSELGVIQPIAEVVSILQNDFPQCRLHVDATQAVGKIPLTIEGVDTISFAAHKFYGLNGSGILYKRRKIEIQPQIHGGASTTRYRSGSPTVALAAAMEKALSLALEQQEKRTAQVREWNTRLRDALQQYPKVRINSPADAVPHILNLSVQDVKGTVFQRALNAHEVCVSVKSACAADGMPSQAVLAVSGDRRNALSSWRISLSHLTTADEICEFLQIFDQCYKELTT